MTSPKDELRTQFFSAERTKAFVDAVVAIAMTLLILPLMDSVSEISEHVTTFQWFRSAEPRITSFVLSFLIIMLFWIAHHRLFTRVTQVTPRLLWLLAAWMLTIVWLPVATAVSGQASDEEFAAKVVYIGSMILTALCSIIVKTYLLRHPELHTIDPVSLRGGIAADLAMAALFGVALGLAWLFPVLGYAPMCVMFGTSALQRLFARLLTPRNVRQERH